MSVILAEFYKHNTWANLRVLAACAALSEAQLDQTFAGTYGSIRATLVHLVGAEERYLRLLGHPLPDILSHGAEYPGRLDLERRVRRSGALFLTAAEAMEARPETPLTGVRNGEPYSLPPAMVLLQVINHGAEHRAHISSILTQLGFPGVAMDGWDYHTAEMGAVP
jgi:uncharacterized damage-inducible protein DinB